MTGRRRSPRYVFLPPIGGRARTILDCVVEHWDGEHAVIVTHQAAAVGDEFVMQFDSPSGGPRACAVRVVSSVPDVEEGAARFRLRVTTSPVSPDWRVNGRLGWV